MNPLASILNLRHFRPPVRRVLAVDAGTRKIKLLLAQSDFGRFRVLKQELIDLQAEGLVSPDEIREHLSALIQTWGHPPLAFTLPEHVSTSQRLDLPLVPEDEVDKLIADQTIKLSGVSESRIIYDFIQVQTAPANKQQFWVTLCQENEIRERALRLGIDREDICEVTTTANALATAYRTIAPESRNAVLIHVGAQTTVLAALVSGENAFASSFQMGGDFFTRAIIRLRQGSEEAAESLKRSQNLLTGPEASTEFAAVVDGWIAEIKRQLVDWANEHPSLAGDLASFEFIGTGGGLELPGLKEYLAQKGLRLKPWPKRNQEDTQDPDEPFAIAFGTAIQALGDSGQHISLLPSDYRAGWQKRLTRQRIEMASMALAIICVFALIMGSWQKLNLIHKKQNFLAKVRAAQLTLEANDSLATDLLSQYESLRPLFLRQQNTIDTLKTLSLLDQVRSNRPFWFVLMADQASYFSHAPAMLSTNRLARTNQPGPALAPPGILAEGPKATWPPSTNLALAKPGLIAELSIPGDPEPTRHVLSALVSTLKQEPLFSKVDLLSEDLRRSLAEPKVTLPDRHFAIALDFSETELQQPLRRKRALLPLARPETSQRNGPVSVNGNGKGYRSAP